MQRHFFVFFVLCLTSCGYSERSHPEKYLKINAEPWEGQDNIELEIINTAEYTGYENISIFITYFENERNVGSESVTHWERISAKSNSVLRAKIHPPPAPVHPNRISFEIYAHAVAD